MAMIYSVNGRRQSIYYAHLYTTTLAIISFMRKYGYAHCGFNCAKICSCEYKLMCVNLYVRATYNVQWRTRGALVPPKEK